MGICVAAIHVLKGEKGEKGESAIQTGCQGFIEWRKFRLNLVSQFGMQILIACRSTGVKLLQNMKLV